VIAGIHWSGRGSEHRQKTLRTWWDLQPEIGALESALDGALAGRGGCAVITGEAEIGKSRLIRELSQMAADRRVAAVTGRAVPASTSGPYRPVTEVQLQLLRTRPLPDDPSMAPWLSHLAALVPCPTTVRPTQEARPDRPPSGGRPCWRA
jgi:predicted ATPase